MTLKEIFNKPIDRPIEGVIKADDEASLRLEAEEYILTNEVAKRLESFLDAYNNYEGPNGVWVSGFFGSGLKAGKSNFCHFPLSGSKVTTWRGKRSAVRSPERRGPKR